MPAGGAGTDGAHARRSVRRALRIAVGGLGALVVLSVSLGLAHALWSAATLRTVIADRVVPLALLEEAGAIANMRLPALLAAPGTSAAVAGEVARLGEVWDAYLATRLTPDEERLARAANVRVWEIAGLLRDPDGADLAAFEEARALLNEALAPLVRLQVEVSRAHGAAAERALAWAAAVGALLAAAAAAATVWAARALTLRVGRPLAATTRALDALADGRLDDPAARPALAEDFAEVAERLDRLRGFLADRGRLLAEERARAEELAGARRELEAALLAVQAKSLQVEAKAAQLAMRVGEKELAERRLADAIDATPAGVVLFDGDLRLILCNAQARRDQAPGVRDMLVPGTRLRDLVHANWRAMFGDAYDAAGADARVEDIASPRPQTREHTLWDGRRVLVITGRTSEGGVIQQYVDLTAHWATRANLEATLDAIDVGVCLWNRDHDLILVNRRMAEIFPLAAEIFRPGLRREDVSLAQVAAGYAAPETLIATHERAVRERRLPDGRVVEVRSAPTASGGSITVYADVTEARTAAERVARSERLASLGTLVAGLAHELNTPIGVAVTATSHVRDMVRGLEDAAGGGRMDRRVFADAVRGITDGAALTASNLERAAGLVSAFKRIAAGGDAGERTPTRLGQWVREVAATIAPAARERGVEIEVSVGEDPEVIADRGAVAQIVINLARNALDHAFPGGGAGRVSLSAGVRDGVAVLACEDDGAGAPPDALPRLFEPFYTTARGRGGTGLGLSIVHTLVVDRLGGEVAASNGRGPDGAPAGFRVVARFPVHGARMVAHGAPTAA